MSAPVLVRHEAHGVQVLTLNRPHTLNALDNSMVQALHEALDDVAADSSCRTLVITGEGRGFCSGLDLGGYGDDEALDEKGKVRGLFERQRDIAGLAQRLHRLRQPVIAAVNGPAAGGGLAIVLASDVRIAAPEAVFAVSFIRAGFSACDIGTSWLLPRIVGAGRAHEWMLTGRRVDAAEAREAGLVVDVVDSDRLVDSTLAKAAEIAMNPPWSVELTKQGMWMALESPSFDVAVEFENRQQIMTAMSEDQAEAMSAFLARRAANYGYR